MGDSERVSNVGSRGTVEYPNIPPPPYSITDPVQNPATGPTIQTIVVQQVLKDEPIYINCPSCHKRVLTTIQFVNSHKTHLIAGFVCGLTLWCMLCCLSAVPYMMQTFKTADHYCPECNYYLGSYSRL